MFGYRKIWCGSNKVFDVQDVQLPTVEFTSVGVWTDIAPEVSARVVPWPSAVTQLLLHALCAKVHTAVEESGGDFLAGCHAVGHAIMAVLPLFVMCDRKDLGTECPSPYQSR